MPDVAVVIPTKDRWQRLSRWTLPSALGQEGVDVEVVVVDDGSEDDTPDGLARLATEDSRVRTLRHERPRGVSAARNTGIAAARAPWIAFLDDDDGWSPRKLASQLATLEHARASWCYTRALAVDEHHRPLYEYYFPEPEVLSHQLLQSAVVPAGASNVVARTDLVRDLGGFDERFLHLEDWDMWLRLGDAASAAAVADVHVAVVFHSQNKHAVSDQADELERLIRKHGEARPPRRLAVDRHGHARWVASQHSRARLNRRAAWLYLRAGVRHHSLGDVARAADALVGKRVSHGATRRRLGAREPTISVPAWLESSFGTGRAVGR